MTDYVILSLYTKENGAKKSVTRRTMETSQDERQVSILGGAAFGKLRETAEHGLCTRRFTPNIVIGGFSAENVNPGDMLRAGGVTLEITRVGKGCYPECPLSAEGITCGLAKQSVFARVTDGGEIKTGDAVIQV